MFDTSADIEIIFEMIANQGITLTESQRKELMPFLRQILKSYPNAKKALEAINAELEKIFKTKIKLEKEKFDAIKNKRKLEQLAMATMEKYLSKLQSERGVKPDKKKSSLIVQSALTGGEINLLVDAAARKLKIKLDGDQRQSAADHFKKHVRAKDSPLSKANAALLSVMISTIAGSVATVVQYSWGNLINIPNVKPSLGYASIDAMKKSLAGKPPSEAFLYVLSILTNGTLDKNALTKCTAELGNIAKIQGEAIETKKVENLSDSLPAAKR